jgi:hypothetical protein
MPRTFPLLLLVLVSCLAVSSVQARTAYNVEIILFENLDVPADPSERWHPRVVMPELEGAVAFERAAVRGTEVEAPPAGFGRIPRERLTLRREREALESSDRYRVIGHFGWYQPALDRDEAIALRITAGEPVRIRLRVPEFPRLETTLPEIDRPTWTADDDSSGVQTTGQANGDANDFMDDARRFAIGSRRSQELDFYPLDGTVMLVVSRYLHILTDLYLTVPVEWAETPLDLMPGRDDPDDASQTRSRDWQGIGSTAVLAATVLFLASPAGGYLTGKVLAWGRKPWLAAKMISLVKTP